MILQISLNKARMEKIREAARPDRTFFLEIGADLSWRKSESRATPVGMPRNFLWRLRRNLRI